MDKAWDLEALKADLKAQGLPIAEEAVEKVAETVKEWIKASLLKSGPLYAAVGIPLVEGAWPEVKKQIDKIDGQPG